MDTPPPDGGFSLDWRVAAPRLAMALLVLVVVVAGASLLLRAQVESASTWFVAEYGAAGVIVGSGLLDAAMLPKEPVLLAGWLAGYPFPWLVGLGSTGALIAVTSMWALGRVFGRRPWVTERLDRLGITGLMARRGVLVVGVAALVPAPYSLIAWAAGASGMPLHRFLLGAACRIPRTAMSVGVVAGGWGLGTLLGG